MTKGFSITFEGPEGSGKSLQIQEISKYLNSQNIDHIITREPGGIGISEQIRNVILDVRNTSMNGRTEALLYAAARRQHLVEKVFPALEAGKVVIIDRFLDSSLAYQGFARGIGIKEVLAINEFAIGDYMPELTLLFDIRPEVGLSRIDANSEREVNRLDLEALEFHNKVREGYHMVRDMFPERIVTIDAEKSIPAVTADVIQVLQKRLIVKKEALI